MRERERDDLNLKKKKLTLKDVSINKNIVLRTHSVKLSFSREGKHLKKMTFFFFFIKKY